MDNTVPKISVIIPAYNVEPYIGELLECVLRQTMQDFEVIIVNDGSTDNTQKVIDTYISKFNGRIKTLYQNNSGQSAARNLAMKNSNGMYYAFLDADDIIADTYLEELFFANQENNAELSRCIINDFEDSLDNTWEACSPKKKIVDFSEEYRFSFFNSPCAGLIRSDFLRKYNISFSVGEQMEDSPYGILINLLTNKTAIVDKILYWHRVHHKASTMTKLSEGKQNPNVPFNGMKNAAEILNNVITDIDKRKIAEYMVLNTLTCFVTSAYKNYSNSVRKIVCDFCYDFLPTYYPEVNKNPYVFGNKRKNIKKDIPVFQRKAVELFVFCYKIKALYLFSNITAYALRFVEKFLK